MANLHRAHLAFMQVDLYRAGHHCDAYFVGRYPVARSWTRPAAVRAAVAPAVVAPAPAAPAPFASAA
jgi:hypothetical protein